MYSGLQEIDIEDIKTYFLRLLRMKSKKSFDSKWVNDSELINIKL